MTISGNRIKADRPEPIISNIDVVPYKQRMDPQVAIDALLDGYRVLIIDYYSSGLILLNELKKILKSSYSDESFQGQREFRSKFRELSNRILLKINNSKLTVRKAPEIGWLKILYPELTEFLLSFPQIQGLNSSWQWYQKGIYIPVLKRKIHPWFGTYFPTRFEHLELFDEWLKKYQGEKRSAIDIGIGSGILSFQMLKHGFKKIYGTDSNPNAIIGLTEQIDRNKLQSKTELFYGDLFSTITQRSELIVFNPPWLPASYDSEGLDKAIYYEKDLFTHFFDNAQNYLKPDGRLVILFSNLAQITKLCNVNPIEEELTKNTQFQMEHYIQKEVRPASKNTQRNQNWRSSENVELWIIKLSGNS